MKSSIIKRASKRIAKAREIAKVSGNISPWETHITVTCRLLAC